MEEENGEQLEEGEVELQTNSPKEKDTIPITVEPSTRSRSNRTKKGTTSTVLEPFAQTTKPLPPTAVGKRGKKY
ncbi:unnamed protein product [Arabis nemorensis]|uniref:Uncharacterized protein n=1 Tax=Arabis nemorensis TaxID=586526 RepID=A0A565CQF6_9BRAS|nr:unnamed protein product [Arabis nemorensis]